MKIEIFGKNYEPSDSLKKITEKKCEKLARRLKDDETAEIKFNICLEGGNYTTDCIVTSKGGTYRAEITSSDPFGNLDTVIPKILGQMEKQKDIYDNKKKGSIKDLKEEEQE